MISIFYSIVEKTSYHRRDREAWEQSTLLFCVLRIKRSSPTMGKLPEWGRRGVRRENGVWVRRGGHPRAREKRKRLPCKITPYGRRCYQRQKDNIRSARKWQVLPMGEKPPFLKGWSEWVRVGEFPLRGKRAISPSPLNSPLLTSSRRPLPSIPPLYSPKGIAVLSCRPSESREPTFSRPVRDSLPSFVLPSLTAKPTSANRPKAPTP